MTTVQNSETSRLAEELHDGIAQDLVALGYALDSIISDSATSLNTRHSVREVRIGVSEILEKTRQDIHDLHHLESSNFFDQLRNLLNEVAPRETLQIEIPGHCPDLRPYATFHILRIIREALRNAREHSQATLVTIVAKVSETQLNIAIENDGQIDCQEQRDGFGLLGASKRAQALGGSLTFGPSPTGFLLTLVLPLQEIAT